MEWILLLIQLLPVVLDLIQKIRELIQGLPRNERRAARAQLGKIARRHIRKRRGGDDFVLHTSEDVVKAELEAFRAELHTRVGG